jgi:hypothetical protein
MRCWEGASDSYRSAKNPAWRLTIDSRPASMASASIVSAAAS